jgi:threonine dehydratase
MIDTWRAPDIADIRASAQRLAGVARVTPLLEAPQINALAGRRVLIKPECLQRTGSFKFRGAWSRLSLLTPDELKRGVIAFSSGNHAQGVAHSAELLGTPAVIVMPKDAPAAKIDATRGYGAEVILYDRETESREDIGAALAEERGLTLVRPYDDRYVISGQGTIGLEIAEQTHHFGIEGAEVVVCCSGGGLSSGIALALESDAPEMRVRPAEPVGFDDFGRSLIAGEKVVNAKMSGSIQDAILTPTPGDLTFPVGQRLFGPGLAASDEETLHAIALAWRWLRIVVEPGGACALATALFRKDELSGDAVIVTVSGGNVDRAIFERALNTLES